MEYGRMVCPKEKYDSLLNSLTGGLYDKGIRQLTLLYYT